MEVIKVDVTLEECQARVVGLDSETQKAVVCALVGHSRIKSTAMWYWYCGRCEAQVGDSLAGIYEGTEDVVIGHDCKTCWNNYGKLTWRDTFLAPNPFARQEGA